MNGYIARYPLLMPTFRSDVRQIAPYRPGRPIADVAAEYGFDPARVVKLASNENPLPPFPEVEKAVAACVSELNRYPDNECQELRQAIAEYTGFDSDHIWVGAGSSEILRVLALSVGGPGTSAVYGWPSFIIYRLASIVAMTERIEVPLVEHTHDVRAMAEALRPDTTIIYLCNPNNPTGTLIDADAVAKFVSSVPDETLVVVDEAYFEYVSGLESAVSLVHAYPNLVVTRTFSKIFGLAGFRVGYAIAQPATISEIRKAQAPFTVSSIAQIAALESLKYPDEIDRRIAENAQGRECVEASLQNLGVEYVPSQANFVYFRAGVSTQVTIDALLSHGVIIRPFEDGWARVSIGTAAENERFVSALENELPGIVDY